jgi:phosphoserine phosphatase RsbU/P
MASELIVRTTDGASKVIKLEADRYSLGRAGTNSLAYPEDGQLSRQHLALERGNDAWLVVDLGSSNGTSVNGVRIVKPTPLKPGDRVTAGRLTLEFSDPDASTQDRHVVFVDKPEEEHRSATVAISLDKLLNAAKAATGVGQAAGPLASVSQMNALIQAGRELADRRPLEELFPLILNLAAEAVGSARGVLMLKESEDLVIRAAKGSSFQISKTVRDRVMDQKESLLIQDVQLDEKLRAQASIVAQSIRSMIAVPLQTKEKVIGLIYLDSPHMIRPFTREDLSLLTVMANIAAIRIENARLTEVEHHERLMAREMAQAAEIQKNLLPHAAPKLPGLDVAGFSEACLSCGGDHYDFYEREGRLVMLVGDVAGKGMPAALLMASLQARVQVLVEEEIDLASMVTRLNRIISSNCPGNRFITFFICEINRTTGEMSYVNAGHNPPLLVRKNGTVEHLAGGGMILGIIGRAAYELQTCRMEEGDLLVMFTDGVTEAERPGTEDDFGDDRLAAALQPIAERTPAEMIEQVKAAVTAFAGSVTSADDFTLVITRKTPIA